MFTEFGRDLRSVLSVVRRLPRVPGPLVGGVEVSHVYAKETSKETEALGSYVGLSRVVLGSLTRPEWHRGLVGASRFGDLPLDEGSRTGVRGRRR